MSRRRDLGHISSKIHSIVAARYTAASSAAVPNSAAIFDFTTKDYDTHNAVTTGASWNFVVPISGKYRVNAILHHTGSLITQFTMAVRINTSNKSISGFPQQVAAASTLHSKIDTTVDLVVGDTIDVTHDESINSATYAVSTTGQYIEIIRIGGIG